jgi:hypothetical protein
VALNSAGDERQRTPPKWPENIICTINHQTYILGDLRTPDFNAARLSQPNPQHIDIAQLRRNEFRQRAATNAKSNSLEISPVRRNLHPHARIIVRSERSSGIQRLQSLSVSCQNSAAHLVICAVSPLRSWRALRRFAAHLVV